MHRRLILIAFLTKHKNNPSQKIVLTFLKTKNQE